MGLSLVGHLLGLCKQQEGWVKRLADGFFATLKIHYLNFRLFHLFISTNRAQ